MFGDYVVVRVCDSQEAADALREVLRKEGIRAKTRTMHGMPGVRLLTQEEDLERADLLLAEREGAGRKEARMLDTRAAEAERLPGEVPESLVDQGALEELDAPARFDALDARPLSPEIPLVPRVGVVPEEAPALDSVLDDAIAAYEEEFEGRADGRQVLRVEDDAEDADFHAVVLRDAGIDVQLEGGSHYSSAPGILLSSGGAARRLLLTVPGEDFARAAALLAATDQPEPEEEGAGADDEEEGNVHEDELVPFCRTRHRAIADALDQVLLDAEIHCEVEGEGPAVAKVLPMDYGRARKVVNRALQVEFLNPRTAKPPVNDLPLTDSPLRFENPGLDTPLPPLRVDEEAPRSRRERKCPRCGSKRVHYAPPPLAEQFGGCLIPGLVAFFLLWFSPVISLMILIVAGASNLNKHSNNKTEWKCRECKCRW